MHGVAQPIIIIQVSVVRVVQFVVLRGSEIDFQNRWTLCLCCCKDVYLLVCDADFELPPPLS